MTGGESSLDIKNASGYTALLWAAKENYSLIVTELTNAGADREIKDGSGDTALLIATKLDHIESVNYLIVNGGTSL